MSLYNKAIPAYRITLLAFYDYADRKGTKSWMELVFCLLPPLGRSTGLAPPP